MEDVGDGIAAGKEGGGQDETGALHQPAAMNKESKDSEEEEEFCEVGEAERLALKDADGAEDGAKQAAFDEAVAVVDEGFGEGPLAGDAKTFESGEGRQDDGEEEPEFVLVGEPCGLAGCVGW